MPDSFKCDFLVVGSGAAGLNYARLAAELGRVIIVTKSSSAESNTFYAQGGIAAVLGESDSFELHVQDTLEVGAGLSKRSMVECVVKEGPERIEELARLGVKFTRRRGKLDLGREGGHSERRIVHAEDLTGREVERRLLEVVMSHPNIMLLENHIAIDLILDRRLKRGVGKGREACWGAYVLDKNSNQIFPIVASETVLATGGAGKVYLYTSNPDVATGDGIAMAYRAGAAVANLEFVQFHPTCLYHPEARSFLISEATRGEGAVLLNRRGERFMARYHPDMELAPRDVVARAIDHEMKRHGDRYVLLDMRPMGKWKIKERFPHIYEKCAALGMDITGAPIPVVPAAHYMCGGVVTDEMGRTSIRGLKVCGEAAHTGLHGANRLASNSLLEALVLSERAARAIPGERMEATRLPEAQLWESGEAHRAKEAVVIDHTWVAVRKLMWDYVGIVRTDHRLSMAARRIAVYREEVESHYWQFLLTSDIIELRNVAQVAELVIHCASMRKESRGLHYNLDHPYPDDEHWKRDTVLRKPVWDEAT